MQKSYTARNTFSKDERLSGKKTIDALFEKGESFLVYPYRVIYLFVPAVIKAPVQIAFGVSKKYSKSAVKRNLIRRRMRESFRKNKKILYDNIVTGGKNLHLFFSFLGKEEIEYTVLETKMIKAFEKLIKEKQKDSK